MHKCIFFRWFKFYHSGERRRKKELIFSNSLQLIVGPLLSIVHVYSVVEEMRATPVNTLNPQRAAMIVADFLKVC